MFEVDTSLLVTKAQSFDDCGYDLLTYEKRVRRVLTELPFSSGKYNGVSSALVKVAQSLGKEGQSARSLASATRTISADYARAEMDARDAAARLLHTDDTSTTEIQGKGRDYSDSHPKTVDTSANKEEDGKFGKKQVNEFIWKLIERVADYFGVDDADFLHGLQDYLEHFKELLDYENWSSNGLKEYLEFAKESAGMVGKIVKALGKSTASKVIGGLSSVFGLASTLPGLFDGTYKSGREFVKAWGDEAVGLTKLLPPGVKNVASGLVQGAWGIVYQTAESVDKALADGRVTFDEIVEMGIDVPIAALWEAADGVTDGLISEDTTGWSGGDISGAVKDWATRTGESLYMRQHGFSGGSRGF